MNGRWQIHVPYGSMLYIPTTTCHLLAAGLTLTLEEKHYRLFRGKVHGKGHNKSKTRQKK